MSYIGTQPQNIKVNKGIYTPNEILKLEKDGNWGGSLQLIEEQTISSTVSAVDFLNIKESVYSVHKLEIINAQSDTDNKDFSLRVKVGSSFIISSDYHRALYALDTSGTDDENRATTSSQMDFTLRTGNATNEKANAYIYIYNAGNSSKYTTTTSHATTQRDSGEFRTVFGGAMYDQASEVNGFRIFMDSSGNITSGVFKLYGLKGTL